MAQNQVLYKFRSVYEREKDDDKSGWKSILFIGDEIKCESCVDKIRKDCGLPDNTTVLLYNAGDQSRPWKDDSHKGYKDSQQISKDTKLVAKKKPVDIAVSDAARGLGETLEEPHQIPDPTGIPRNRLKLVADDADLGGAQFYIIGGKKYVFESQIGYFERYIKEKDHLRRLDGRGQGRAKNAAYALAPPEDPVLREHFSDYRHPFDFLRLYLPGLAKVNNPMKAAYLLPHKNFRPAPPRVQPPPVIRPPPIALPPPPVSAPSSQVAEGAGSDSRVDDRTSRGVARDRDASRTDERESSFSKQDKDRSSTGDRNDRDWDERGARSRDEARDRERERDRNRDRDRDRDKGGRERGGERSPKRSRR